MRLRHASPVLLLLLCLPPSRWPDGPSSRTGSQTLGRTGKPGSRQCRCLSTRSPGAQMLLSCHQSRGEERALQQGCAQCQPWRQHTQPDGCGGAPRSPFLCPAPKAEPPRASERRTWISQLEGRCGQRERPRRVSGRLGHPQLSPPGHPAECWEMLTTGTAKRPVPLPEGMWAPRLLLDGQGVLWRARAREHHRKLL